MTFSTNSKKVIGALNKTLKNNLFQQQVNTIAKKIKEINLENKITLIFGNGGSAADSQHFASELVGRYERNRDGFSAISLTTDSSALTAISNDYGFENVFSRQIDSIGNKGDLLIVLSTSGNSKNVIKSLEEAKKKKIITIGFTGKANGNMKPCCDYLINIPSDDTPRIQECHLMLGHAICELVEKELFS